jgi:hypothetical protein
MCTALVTLYNSTGWRVLDESHGTGFKPFFRAQLRYGVNLYLQVT